MVCVIACSSGGAAGLGAERAVRVVLASARGIGRSAGGHARQAPGGFEVFAELVGEGTPEAMRAALETLQGTMPRWLTEQNWWLHGSREKAAEEAWWRSGAVIPLNLFDDVEVEF